jgi:hypothetical protein
MVMSGLSRQTSAAGAGRIPADSTPGLLAMLTPLLDRNRDGSIVDEAIGMIGGFLSDRRSSRT